jgi:Zinc-binding loop region of homing endonuclease
MLEGQHASHLCHQPTCINPLHINVEEKTVNESRKDCGRLGLIIETEINGAIYRLEPQHKCSCPGPKCIFRVERRIATLVKP